MSQLRPSVQTARSGRTSVYSLPLYLGTQRTAGGRPLMLKCLPSKWEHCSSRKSFCPRGHGSVLQERNFIRRPTQNFPPFLGLEQTRDGKNARARQLFSIQKRAVSVPRLTLSLQTPHCVRLTSHVGNQALSDWRNYFQTHLFTTPIEARVEHTLIVCDQFDCHDCRMLSYSGLLQSLPLLRVPPPQDLEQTL